MQLLDWVGCPREAVWHWVVGVGRLFCLMDHLCSFLVIFYGQKFVSDGHSLSHFTVVGSTVTPVQVFPPKGSEDCAPLGQEENNAPECPPAEAAAACSMQLRPSENKEQSRAPQHWPNWIDRCNLHIERERDIYSILSIVAHCMLLHPSPSQSDFFR